MLAIGLALGASLMWGCGDFLGGLKSRVLPLLAVLLCSQAAGLVAIAVVTLVSGQAGPSGHHVAMAVLGAVCGTAGLAAFYRALAVGKMGVVVPISATAATLPVIVGIARGERPSTLQVVGMALALAGVVIASREHDEVQGRTRLAAGALLAAGSAVGFGAFFLAMDSAAKGGAVWATLVNRTTSVTLLLLAVLALRPPMRVVRPHLPVLAVVGLFDVMANLAFAAASTKGLVSLVSVGSSLYPVVTLVLARVFLRERVHRTQGLGIAAALLGVVLIAAG
jgi:drug/metabolite transporter (DMT)-like permease